MIIPSIDLMDGRAVQLVGGKEKVIDAGDPIPIARQFALAGEIAVVDLDAALGRGSNAEVIKQLIRIAPCRVGGGIRDVETALEWLDYGAEKIMLGTKAVPEVLKELPRERVIAALDAVNGEVVVNGWQTKTGKNVSQQMNDLQELVGGFLVTSVEREGRLQGIDLETIAKLADTAGGAQLTIAGGITTVADLAAINNFGADAQVGMALYSGKLSLADAIAAPLIIDAETYLWPTVITDEHGIALGLAWSNRESLSEAVQSRSGVYCSRKRGIWKKGESSGATQELLRIDLDCDSDTIRFAVRQHGAGFCHKGSWTCWGNDQGLTQLSRLIESRKNEAPKGSYTKELLTNRSLLQEKLIEEAEELGTAESPEQVIWEAADLLYFTLTALAREGISLADVEKELHRRALEVTRKSEGQRTLF